MDERKPLTKASEALLDDPTIRSRLLSDVSMNPARPGTLHWLYDRLAAVEAEVRKDERERWMSAVEEAEARGDDMRWCRKPDDCHIAAEGVALAIDDILAAMEADRGCDWTNEAGRRCIFPKGHHIKRPTAHATVSPPAPEADR